MVHLREEHSIPTTADQASKAHQVFSTPSWLCPKVQQRVSGHQKLHGLIHLRPCPVSNLHLTSDSVLLLVPDCTQIVHQVLQR